PQGTARVSRAGGAGTLLRYAQGRSPQTQGETEAHEHVKHSADHAARMGGYPPRLQRHYDNSSLPPLWRVDLRVAARPEPRRMRRREWARMDRAQAKDHARPRRSRNVRGTRGGGRTCLNPRRGKSRSEERRVGKECRSRWSRYE